jgi:chromosome segregation ATPase
LKRVAEALAEQSMVETGLTECLEASKYWEGLKERSASYDDYQQQYELSKKKVTKLKVKIEGLSAQLDQYGAGILKLEEEKAELGEQVKQLEVRLESERDENRRYGEALADARRQIDVLVMEGVEGLGGFSQATDRAYLD